jgi:hypothetical protein
MGLDQYAYVANKVNSTNDSSTELAYWRKHPNLQGWMESLWIEKGKPGVEDHVNEGMFNGIELELTFDDIVRLEEDIKNNNLPATTGFFFGNPSDDYYKNQDLEFVYEAKSRLFLGQKVFYNSSW